VTRTVDLVVVGDHGPARAAAIEALQGGRRVLVVLRAGDGPMARRLRRSLSAGGHAAAGQLTLITGAEVVCADGIGGVEAVVVRHLRTGRLSAVNTSACVSGGSGASQPAAARSPRGEPRRR
jgi:hypothetical protein